MKLDGGIDISKIKNLYKIDSDEPYFVTNKKGEIIEVSNAFCNKLGIPKRDLFGKRFFFA